MARGYLGACWGTCWGACWGACWGLAGGLATSASILLCVEIVEFASVTEYNNWELGDGCWHAWSANFSTATF
jgi:hypothetical protein